MGALRKPAPTRDPHARYRNALQTKRTEVLASLGIKFDALARLGRVAEEDQASISHDEFISLRRNSLDYTQLRLVDEALDRLGSGDYGVCPSCEEPIPSKRLDAIPWARYCVPCQESLAERLDDESESPPHRRPPTPIDRA